MGPWGYGEIGKRSGLKIRRLRPCGFEPHCPYHLLGLAVESYQLKSVSSVIWSEYPGNSRCAFS